jgi:hypothetical protein
MNKDILKSLDDFLDYIISHPDNEEGRITKNIIPIFFKNKENFYKEFSIPKKSGKFRSIESPTKQLKILQGITKDLLEEYYTKDQVPTHVFGYVQGRGIKENAQLHVRKKYVLNIDIKNFFKSITKKMIIERLSYKPFSIHRRSIINRIIAEIVTFNDYLPTGSPTSPIVSNIVLKEFDYSMVMFSKKYGLTYSRYADDLTFSTNKPHDFKSIINSLQQRVAKFGFKLNKDKTRLQCSGSRQIVTGLVVNSKVSVKKEFISLTKCMLNNWWVYGIEEAQERYDANKRVTDGVFLENVVRGRIDFIGYILNPTKKKFHPTYVELFKKYWILNYKADLSFIKDEIIKNKLKTINLETEIIASDKLTAENQEIRFISYCFNTFRQLELLYGYFFFAKLGRSYGNVMLYFCRKDHGIMKKFYPNPKNLIGPKTKKIIGRDLSLKISYNDLSNLELIAIAEYNASNSIDLSRLNANELEDMFLSDSLSDSSKTKTKTFDYLRKIRNHYAHSLDNVFDMPRSEVMDKISKYEKMENMKFDLKTKIDRGNNINTYFEVWKKYTWLDKHDFDEVRGVLELVVNDVRKVEEKSA